MNFRISRGARSVLVAALSIALLTPVLSSEASTKVLGKAKVNTANLPTVTAHAGVAPVISKPVGTPPKNLVTKDIFVGKGKSAITGSTVTAHYVLMSWKTGKVIESSWSSPQAPTFSLLGVIPGWQQGIPGMKVGGRRLLVIPPALAYGANGSGPVGPNETLIFVVDLVAVS